MASHGQIERLLRDSRLWHAGRSSPVRCASIATGWPALDNALGGGWPLGQLTELLIDAHGVGELSLLLPALARLSARQGGTPPAWVTLVAAPHVPYAPALARSGLDLSRLLVVRSKRDTDTLWAIEQALHSRTCAAVVGWLAMADASPLRRLQLAAEASGSWAVLVRPAHLQEMRSPAPLRIRLERERATRRLVLGIVKRRGGAPTSVAVDVG